MRRIASYTIRPKVGQLLLTGECPNTIRQAWLCRRKIDRLVLSREILDTAMSGEIRCKKTALAGRGNDAILRRTTLEPRPAMLKARRQSEWREPPSHGIRVVMRTEVFGGVRLSCAKSNTSQFHSVHRPYCNARTLFAPWLTI